MTALTLYQDRLNAVSRAVLVGDFAAYRALIDAPYLVTTLRGPQVLADDAALAQTFFGLSRSLLARGVTHYERLARAVTFTRPDQIEGWHYTHMIAGQARIAAPHAARQTLALRGGVWRFAQAAYPVTCADWPSSGADALPHIDAVADLPLPGHPVLSAVTHPAGGHA